MGRRTFFAGLAAVFCCLSVPLSAAEPTLEAQGPTLLTISGAMTAGDGEIEFDRAMLESLDWAVCECFTDWTEGLQVFEGPTLSSVLEAVGATGTTLFAVALDDYTVEIPIADAATYGVILAMKQNGQNMRVRNKGPIWVIYPHKSASDAKYSDVNSKMIWQLKALKIDG